MGKEKIFNKWAEYISELFEDQGKDYNVKHATIYNTSNINVLFRFCNFSFIYFHFVLNVNFLVPSLNFLIFFKGLKFVTRITKKRKKMNVLCSIVAMC